MLLIGKLINGVWNVIRAGAEYGVTWNFRTIRYWSLYTVWLLLIVYGPRWNLAVWLQVLGKPFGWTKFGLWLDLYIGRSVQFATFLLLPFCAWLFSSGFWMWIRTTRFQKGINNLGLKSPTGATPKVTRVVNIETHQKRVLVYAAGFDIESFRNKKGVLETSFGMIVQDIKICAANRQLVEILLSEKELPTMVKFEDHSARLTHPYSFLVGQTMDDFIVGDLCDLHHMLVAGATGGGKSVFFKQALVGLLKSSRNIQLYLIDLKRGVEMKPFEVLKNVQIAKEEATAVTILQSVNDEMERRFRYMEEKGFSEISPSRDKLDRIVVAVDEASVLYFVSKVSPETRALALKARDLTDKLAKLGRAAGVHVVLATQKVVKETIDMNVQTNIKAKMCFRMNNLAGSNTMLGNRKALDLPNIRGRGIWSVGSVDQLIQVPYLDEEAIADELQELCEKFNAQPSPLHQKMLNAPRIVQMATQDLIVKSEKDLEQMQIEERA